MVKMSILDIVNSIIAAAVWDGVKARMAQVALNHRGRNNYL